MQSPLPEKFGKFKVIREIGKGGFGVVYEGRDPILKRSVAIKTCNSDDEGLRLRFQREAEIVASLQHPNITTVHDLGVEDGVPYLVQEYLSGKDLSQVILARKPVPLARKIEILKGVASGLEQAHRRGIIHRDIKPGNIRLLDDGSVKVMDFGIAKLLADSEVQLTQTGMMIGTAAYLAPEQVSDVEVDHRCDIFSFGVVAYELLSYQRPFSGTTISALLYKINHDAHAPLSSVFSGAPPALASLVDDCLSKDPDGRPLSFTDVLRRLAGGKAIRRNTSEDATRALRGDMAPPAGAAPPTAENLAAGATVMTSREAVTRTDDPLAQTILETQVEMGEGETPSTAERVVTESAMSQMFQKASRPSVLAVAVMAAVAAGAIWFGLSRAGSPNVLTGVEAAVVDDGEATSASTNATGLVDSGGGDTQDSGLAGSGSTIASGGSQVEGGTGREVASMDSKVAPELVVSKNTAPAVRPKQRSNGVDRASTRPPGSSRETAATAGRREVRPEAKTRTSASANDPAAPDSTDGGPVPVAPTRSIPVPSGTSSEKAPEGSAAKVQEPAAPTREVKTGVPTNASPADSPPVPIDHEPALRKVLDAYADAIRNMDAGALGAIWPSLSDSQLKRFESSFSNARQMDIEISRCTFDIGSQSATAKCRVKRGITPKAGRVQSNTSTRTFRFRLQDAAWALESV